MPFSITMWFVPLVKYAPFTTAFTFCRYPRVRYIRDFATRSGVFLSPSRSTSSPSSIRSDFTSDDMRSSLGFCSPRFFTTTSPCASTLRPPSCPPARTGMTRRRTGSPPPSPPAPQSLHLCLHRPLCRAMASACATQAVRDESLPAEAGMHRHDQDFVHLSKIREYALRRRLRVDGHGVPEPHPAYAS